MFLRDEAASLVEAASPIMQPNHGCRQATTGSGNASRKLRSSSVSKTFIKPAVMAALLASICLWPRAGLAQDSEDCVPGKTCPHGKVYSRLLLMRMSCQALEDLEDQIIPPETRLLDPIKSYEALSPEDRLNIARIHAAERLKGCLR